MSNTKIRDNIERMRKELKDQKEQIQAEKKAEYEHRKHNARNKKWAKFYNSKQWQTLRKLYITEHPLCENCEKHGLIKEANHVHHKLIFGNLQSYDDKWNALLNYDNLMSLCTKCHKKMHEIADREGLDYIDNAPIDELIDW